MSLEQAGVIKSASSRLEEGDEDCSPNPPSDDQTIRIDPFAACIKDGDLSSNTAEFSFDVVLDRAVNKSKDWSYLLTPSGVLSNDDYAFNVKLSDGVSLKEGGAQGELEVDAGVSQFKVTITAAASDSLIGNEEIDLTIFSDSGVASASASLVDLNCVPSFPERTDPNRCAVVLADGQLHLDVATDHPHKREPSGSPGKSGSCFSLCLQQALRKAGYGFSRKGESGVLSEAGSKLR